MTKEREDSTDSGYEWSASLTTPKHVPTGWELDAITLAAERDRLRSDLARVTAERDEARAVLEATSNAVWAFCDLDPEHTVKSHADSLPKAYLAACEAIDNAKQAMTPKRM